MKLGQQPTTGWSLTLVALISGGLMALPTSTVIVSAASTSDNATHSVQSMSNKTMQGAANATHQAAKGAAAMKSSVLNAINNKAESAAKTVNQSSCSIDQGSHSIYWTIFKECHK